MSQGKCLLLIGIVLLLGCIERKSNQVKEFCRGRQVCIKEYREVSEELPFAFGPYVNIVNVFGINEEEDTVYVYGTNRKRILIFQAKYKGIRDSVMAFQDPETGRWRIDSFRIGKGHRTKTEYFHWFYGNPRVSTQYYADRKVYSKLYFAINGKDSLQYRFTPAGDLSRITNFMEGRQIDFWSPGILREVRQDTQILGNLVLKMEEFHKNGTLASRQFYHDDSRCLTWKYFNDKGIEINRIQYQDLVQQKEPPVVENLEFFVFINEIADFGGGRHAFENFIKSNLEKRVKLRRMVGTYMLRLRIDEQGFAKLVSIQSDKAEFAINHLKEVFGYFELNRMFRPKRVKSRRAVISSVRIELIISK